MPPVVVAVAVVEVAVADEVRVGDARVTAGVELAITVFPSVLRTILVLNPDVGKSVGFTRHTRWYSEYHAVSSYISSVHSVSAVMLWYAMA